MVLLVAHSLFFVHLALVDHAVCPQHGNLAHSQHSHASVQGGLDGMLTPRAAVTGTAPDAGGGHDHCRACTVTHERYALMPPACHGVGDLPLALPFLPASDADAFVRVPPIVLSPKTSPPAG
jgi:hypothetical protein